MEPDKKQITNETKKVEPHCMFFVTRKRRYCRISPNEGEEFCGEHKQPEDISSSSDLTNASKVRIVCPLDKKHTCYAHKLNKHLKICNARQGVVPEYIVEGVNSGKSEKPEDETPDNYKLLSTFTSAEITDTIAKVTKIFDDHVHGKISDKTLQHKLLEDEMSKPEYGEKTKKHLKQASAILSLLDHHSLLSGNTCYIEFGAGRGQLTYWIVKATEGLDNVTALLVERASPKHKHDNKLKNMGNDGIQRIRADIANLVLDKVEAVRKTQKVVSVTKHLCGEATDLAMRCLANTSENQDKIRGLLMTFCCHHRCRWTPYVGKEFLKAVGLTRNDFDIMCGMVSWATCGTGFSRERRKNMSEAEQDEINKERDLEIGLTREEKEAVGRKCKNILNWGRLVYLEDKGFECALYHYVSTDVSLENVCIVAEKNKITEIKQA